MRKEIGRLHIGDCRGNVVAMCKSPVVAILLLNVKCSLSSVSLLAADRARLAGMHQTIGGDVFHGPGRPGVSVN